MMRRTLLTGFAVLAAMLLSAGATTKYVTPSGGGSFSGDDWANAYSNVQAAINACPSASDEVRLSYGVYSNTSQLMVTNHAGLTIRGGYLGSGEDVTSTPTVLTRSLSVTNRIVYGQASTLTLDRLWVVNGLGVTNGVGVYLTNCITLVTNCVIASNSLVSTVGGVIQGGGLYAATGTLTVANSQVRNNILSGNTATGNRFGAGLFAMNAAVTLSGVAFVSNTITCVNPDYGAGAYLMGGSARITGCSFETNTIDNTWNVYGIGLGADSVKPLTISNCFFRGNSSSGTAVYYVTGGALYMGGTTLFDVSACEFVFNFLAGNASGVYAQGKRGSAIYLTGTGVGGVISDCSMTGFTNGIALEMIYADVWTTNRVTVRNTTIRGAIAEGGGVYKQGPGTLILTNCLVAATAAHGLHATAGTTIVAQCTLADNRGWGVSNAPALVAITNSVIWGNYIGGVSSTNGKYSYTCSQDALAGTGNMTNNPLFVAGYYLSAAGLPFQGADSPCIDAGSASAAEAGLDARSTRTDGVGDSGQVDLGYHAPTSMVVAISNLILYVNVVTGSDANDGWTAGSPLKTLGAAFGRAIDGSTLYVATGRYYRASGETFPLTSRTPNLRIVGANRATTILDATGTNRVFSADGRGRVWFEGLTVTGGHDPVGAGLYLPACQTVITNCVITGNKRTTYAYVYGCGIYATLGTLDVSDSVIRDNGTTIQMEQVYGGGIYAASAAVTLRNVIVDSNFQKVNSGAYGAGVYLSGGNASIAGCTFTSNRADVGYNHQGMALYATAVNPLVLSNCTFIGNYSAAFNGSSQGGALWISSCKPLTVTRCTFSGNKVASNISREGGAMLLTGAGLGGTISECDITGEPSGITPEAVSIDTASTNGMVVRDSVIRGVVGSGLNKKGTGFLLVSNCLVYSFAGHAVLAGTGTVTVANCTLADNGGWGVTNALAVLNVANSIVWGNQVGAIASTNGSIAYTCATNIPAGSGNFAADPRWVAGYYLSVNGLPYQAVDSPCINAGSAAASVLGLDTRTTRTDGSGDSGTVDLGYHAPTSAVVALSNMVLYVNVVTGSDANDGWTSGSPLKTITAALGKTISGSTIYVATGRYYQASGEVFPLASRQANLTVIGANRDTTLLDATATNRVFSADGRGMIWLEGLTFTNGHALSGAGIFLPGCRTVITNCLVAGNRYGIYATVTGCGIYALNGTLDVLDSVVLANGTSVGMSDVYGAGIYASGAAVTLRKVTVSANYLKPNNIALGAGVCLSGGSALVDGCAFLTNRMDTGYGHQGVGLYSTAVNPFTVRNSSFVGNYSAAGNGISYGAGLASVSGPVTITNCTFLNNNVGTVNSAARGGALMLQDAGPFLIASSAFTGNIVRASTTIMEGGVMFLTGNGLAGVVSDCMIASSPAMSNAAPENLSVAPGISNVIIRNTLLAGGRGSGIGKYGNGSLTLTNCLVQGFTNHGILVATGSLVVANVTLVNNRGWGLVNTTNAVTVRNSIAWGNTNGGFSGSGNAISYTCSQNPQAGTGNTSANPLFVGTNDFRLVKASPCVNAGLTEAGMAGMVDLAGNPRIIGRIVDMGAYEMTAPPSSGTVIMVQ